VHRQLDYDFGLESWPSESNFDIDNPALKSPKIEFLAEDVELAVSFDGKGISKKLTLFESRQPLYIDSGIVFQEAAYRLINDPDIPFCIVEQGVINDLSGKFVPDNETAIDWGTRQYSAISNARFVLNFRKRSGCQWFIGHSHSSAQKANFLVESPRISIERNVNLLCLKD
jgi:hypothetical protein